MKRLLPLGALLLAACTVTPERTVHEPQLPLQFVSSGQAPSPQLWWQAWSQVELDELIRQAFADNPGLAQTRARLSAAQASLAGGQAALFPQLNASAETTDGFADNSDQSVTRVGLAAAYELDLWGRVRSQRQALALETQATAQDLRAAEISLSASVASLWFQIGAARERLQLIRTDRQNYETTLGLIETRYRQGQLNAGNVLQQRQLLESTRASEALATSELATLRHALSEMLGGDWRDDWPGAQDWQLPTLPQTGLAAQTVMRRPDVEQAWLRVLAADRELGAAIAARFPQLNLSASLTSSDAGVLELFDQWIGSLAASLLGPVFDAGARRAEVDRQRAVLDQRVAEFRAQALLAFREIQDALVNDQALQQRVASLLEQQRLADAAVQSLLVQLRHGASDFPSLLDAQISFSSVKRDLLSARQQLIDNRITLYRALAGPLPQSSDSDA